ncbi:cadherin-related family member 5 [Sardina pilchardus]|uniref:cadherin-related family member 5 n=1 Tax=Sardina pilchardus TaxID=27697 RepID=UPI002E0F7A52
MPTYLATPTPHMPIYLATPTPYLATPTPHMLHHSTTDYFKLESPISANIVMSKLLDYDTVKSIEFNLIVQDTETSTPPSHTATAKVIITVKDVDNRPPWFQPCTPEVIGQAKVCLNTGYTGQVILTQQAPGPLPLKPESLRAVDGDEFIKALISYRLLSVSDIFAVNENTGEITMKKAADVAGPIVLTVMAYQTLNADRFATTTVTFEVKNTNNSLHPPTFEKASYDGYISLDAGVGSLVLEGEHSSKPLQLQATDQDFADGLNPFMQYELQGSSEFSITQQGFIIMTRAATAGAVSFQVRAVDTESGEEAETAVKLEVSPDPVIQVPGTYRVEDMVAVGVPLGILLLIAVVMIVLLAVYINGHKKDASKIKEVSHFHSNLESGGGFGLKGGVHYSNKGFQGDGDDDGDDGDSMASDEPDRARAAEAPVSRAAAAPLYETTRDDTASIAESSKSEKEVKPILTKERKDDEGYKAVWFKQDIDPQVEVSIIPERTEQEDDDDDDDEDEDALGGYASRRGVQFTDDDGDGSVQGEDEDENSDVDDHLQRREEDDDDDPPQTSDL